MQILLHHSVTRPSTGRPRVKELRGELEGDEEGYTRATAGAKDHGDDVYRDQERRARRLQKEENASWRQEEAFFKSNSGITPARQACIIPASYFELKATLTRAWLIISKSRELTLLSSRETLRNTTAPSRSLFLNSSHCHILTHEAVTSIDLSNGPAASFPFTSSDTSPVLSPNN